jgi:flavin reductase (DIM6/NTAB) family NADH-FMN oxidoreductase RutF
VFPESFNIKQLIMHKVSDTPILYFGTPVLLISTINENETYNLAPMSSAFWLGWRCIIGLSAFSKTTENLVRTKECVLNLPSVNQVNAVNQLALTTGSNPVPDGKIRKGYRYEPSKFEISGLTPVPADFVKAPKVLECPVQMEAKLMRIHPVGEDEPQQRGRIVTFELKIVRVHLEEAILFDGCPNRVDADAWRPLIMSFQKFYGLGEQLRASRLATVPEELYKTRDIETAKM